MQALKQCTWWLVSVGGDARPGVDIDTAVRAGWEHSVTRQLQPQDWLLAGFSRFLTPRICLTIFMICSVI